MTIKEKKNKALFDKFDKEIPNITRLIMLDMQKHLDESYERQKNAKKFIQSRIYYYNSNQAYLK